MQLNAVRLLLASVALVAVGSVMAQSTDKEPSGTSKQSNTKPSTTKPAAAPKRLDFAPTSNVKETTGTRDSAPGPSQAGQAPAKKGSNCHSPESDA